MLTALGRELKNRGARASVEWARAWPSRPAIYLMRILNGIQLSPAEIRLVAGCLRRRAPCRLLVFGLGNDSRFWAALNRGGDTVFLEDNERWLQKVATGDGDIRAFLVRYDTCRRDWRRYLARPSLLQMELPPEVEAVGWDVILVDAPLGWNEGTAGRMKSIFLSARLAAAGADVFVHDCEREVEDVYCNTFLKPENLQDEIRDRTAGYLRHYRLASADPG